MTMDYEERYIHGKPQNSFHKAVNIPDIIVFPRFNFFSIFSLGTEFFFFPALDITFVLLFFFKFIFWRRIQTPSDFIDNSQKIRLPVSIVIIIPFCGKNWLPCFLKLSRIELWIFFFTFWRFKSPLFNFWI